MKTTLTTHSPYSHHFFLVSFSLFTLHAFHHFFLSLALLTIAHSLTVDLFVLIKWVCSKIVYFGFTSFSKVKNTFRNSEIKNLGWFDEFSNDCPISHWNFDANSMHFRWLSKYNRKSIEIFIGNRIPIENFDGNLNRNLIPIHKFQWESRWEFDSHWFQWESNSHRTSIEIFRWEFN